MFGGTISQSTPHLYLSALPFSPQDSIIYQTYAAEFPPTRGARVVSGRITTWPAYQSVLSGHTAAVNCAAFSPDGKHIVSGSQDATIRVWNARVDERAYKAKSMGSTQVLDSPSPHIMPHSPPVADSADLAPAGQLWDSTTLSYSDPGWAVGQGGELLFWVLPNCRAGLWWPRTLAIMGPSKITVDVSRFVHGTSWVDCRTGHSN